MAAATFYSSLFGANGRPLVAPKSEPAGPGIEGVLHTALDAHYDEVNDLIRLVPVIANGTRRIKSLAISWTSALDVHATPTHVGSFILEDPYSTPAFSPVTLRTPTTAQLAAAQAAALVYLLDVEVPQTRYGFAVVSFKTTTAPATAGADPVLGCYVTYR
jgi:hypothetical protein